MKSEGADAEGATAVARPTSVSSIAGRLRRRTLSMTKPSREEGTGSPGRSLPTTSRPSRPIGAGLSNARDGLAGPDVPVRTGDLRLHSGDHDDLRPQLDVAQIGVRQEPVQGARHVESRALAVDAVVGGQQGGAEGDLYAGAFREPCERVGEGQPNDIEMGWGGEEGAGLGFDADQAP